MSLPHIYLVGKLNVECVMQNFKSINDQKRVSSITRFNYQQLEKDILVSDKQNRETTLASLLVTCQHHTWQLKAQPCLPVQPKLNTVEDFDQNRITIQCKKVDDIHVKPVPFCGAFKNSRGVVGKFQLASHTIFYLDHSWIQIIDAVPLLIPDIFTTKVMFLNG